MDVVVTGIGLLSASGEIDRSWQNLLAGNSGIKLQQPYSKLPPLPLALIGDRCCDLPLAARPIDLNEIIPRVVTAAVTDAKLNLPLADCGVVIGSSRFYQAVWERLAAKNPLPAQFDWQASLPASASRFAARQIGSNAVISAPMAACATGTWCLAIAFEAIKTGQYRRVIAGAVEAPITPLTLAGFSQIGALAKTGCYPFDRDREGLVLGEGGAVLVLESAEVAASRNAKIYGQLLGFGLTCDAYHISRPESRGKQVILAIEQCLQRSNLNPNAIDYIHAHGTSTKLNDIREAQIIAELFGDRVAVSSTKGATGHTLGASGAIGAAFALLALKAGKLPPCIGLRRSEFGINLVSESRFANLKKILCFNFGFGGQNAIMALGKYEKI